MSGSGKGLREDGNGIVDEWTECLDHLFLLYLRKRGCELRGFIDEKLKSYCPQVDGLFDILKLGKQLIDDGDLHLVGKEGVEVLLVVLDARVQSLQGLLDFFVFSKLL
jgi:hypothetical protein